MEGIPLIENEKYVPIVQVPSIEILKFPIHVFLEDIDPPLNTNFQFHAFSDINIIFKILINTLNGSSGVPGTRLFLNNQDFRFPRF